MSTNHLLRVGLFGQVGRFTAPDGVRYPRKARVICRTVRGTEVGEVLADDDIPAAEVDGTILRPVTVEDQLLLARLEQRKSRAITACQDRLRERGSSAVLMDAEHLFDGRGLYFYFLGELSPEVDAITTELAQAYDAEVQFHRFAETLTQGCGPGCGTEAATGQGCGSGGCSSCAVAAACHPRR